MSVDLRGFVKCLADGAAFHIHVVSCLYFAVRLARANGFGLRAFARDRGGKILQLTDQVLAFGR